MAMPELTFSALAAPGGLASSLTNLIQTIYGNRAAERREAKSDAMRARERNEQRAYQVQVKRDEDYARAKQLEEQAAMMQQKAEMEAQKAAEAQRFSALQALAAQGDEAAKAELGRVAGLPPTKQPDLAGYFARALGIQLPQQPVANPQNPATIQPNANVSSQSPAGMSTSELEAIRARLKAQLPNS